MNLRRRTVAFWQRSIDLLLPVGNPFSAVSVLNLYFSYSIKLGSDDLSISYLKSLKTDTSEIGLMGSEPSEASN
jgi:hypothetical protein